MYYWYVVTASCCLWILELHVPRTFMGADYFIILSIEYGTGTYLNGTVKHTELLVLPSEPEQQQHHTA